MDNTKRYERLLERYKERHPDVQKLDRRIRQLQEQGEFGGSAPP